MSAKQWTVPELERVHKLPHGKEVGGVYWSWEIWSGHPVAVSDGGTRWVFVSPEGVLRGAKRLSSEGTSVAWEPPAAVALPVILASKGLDSAEAMALELDRGVHSAYAYSIIDSLARRATDNDIEEILHEAYEEGMQAAAEMLRRGTVTRG